MDTFCSSGASRAVCNLSKVAGTGILDRIDVVHDQIVNAIALTIECGTAIVGQAIRNLQSGAHVTDRVIADRHIRDQAIGAEIG